MSMHWMWLDWVFLAILALSTLLAFFRGFVREALSLLSWAAALIVALIVAPSVGRVLFFSIKNSSVQYGAGFLLAFFSVLILGMIINYFLGNAIRMTGLGFFDTILGGVFGFVRGVCFVLIILLLMAMPSLNMTTLLDRSAIASFVNPFVVWASKDLANHPEYSHSLQSTLKEMDD